MVKEIKLKTSFDFDSAHRLVGYDGKCSNLHGHIWHCDIEVVGHEKDLDDVGILWDFTNAKQLKDLFDHKTILKDCLENNKLIECLEDTCGTSSVYLMKENPTAENLCLEILNILRSRKLKYKITVWESPKSSCEVEE